MWSSAPWPVRLWFIWAFGLLALSGLLLPQIVGFVDFSERAPFSLLGIFSDRVSVDLSDLAVLAVPILAGLPPALFRMEPAAANGWYALTIPLGLLISAGLVAGLLRPSSRGWFTED